MKTTAEIEKEFDEKFNIAYVKNKGFAFLGEEIKQFWLSTLDERMEWVRSTIKEKSYFVKPSGNQEQNNGKLLHEIIKEVVDVDDILSSLNSITKGDKED